MIKAIVERRDTAAGRWFDAIVQGLIVLSLVSFSVETLPDLNDTTCRLLGTVEVGTVSLFTVEYILRFSVADDRWGFATSFFGIVDLAAILPFYLATGLDLRAIRIFRFLRLFRAVKLLRYRNAVLRLRRAWMLVREELLIFITATAILLFATSVGIYYFEHDAQPEAFASIFHSLWWAVATLTTVGYGDVYPITVGGRVFTFLVLMIGLGIVAVPAGVLASALSEVRRIDAAVADDDQGGQEAAAGDQGLRHGPSR